MGNVHMEATQINFRGGASKMNVEEAIKSAIELTPEQKTNINKIPTIEAAVATKTDQTVIAPEFDAEAGTYAIGDMVMHEGKLYEFTSAHETAGDWNAEEVSEKTVSDEIDTVKSGLTNLQNDVEGEWEELSVSDVLTVDQNLTLDESTSKIYRRGKMIRTLLYFTGTLTFGADGQYTIAVIKTGYRPAYSSHQSAIFNSASSGRAFGTADYGVYTSGNINLCANKYNTTIGTSGYSWTAGYAVMLIWEIA